MSRGVLGARGEVRATWDVCRAQARESWECGMRTVLCGDEFDDGAPGVGSAAGVGAATAGVGAVPGAGGMAAAGCARQS